MTILTCADPQTLFAACSAARTLLAKGESVTLFCAPGVYELPEPLVLDFSSAEAGATFTLRGEGTGEVSFSGGQRLTDWALGYHGCHSAWHHLVDPDWDFRQLFVNGTRRSRPRTPREGMLQFSVSDSLRLGDGDSWPLAGTEILAPEFAEELEFVVWRYWLDLHLPVRSVSADRKSVAFGPKDFPPLIDENGQGARFFIDNDRSAFGEPGDWFLNRAGGVLTYLPLPGETWENTEIIAPRLPALLQIVGDQRPGGKKTSGVTVEGITFSHAEWHLPRENWGAGQAQFFLPGAIQFRGASGCTLRGCTVRHVSCTGIEVLRGSHHNVITDCEITDCGAGGIKVNHDGKLRPWGSVGPDGFVGLDREAMGWEFAEGDDEPPEEGANTTIHRCHIHSVGHLYPSAAAVWIGDSAGNSVTSNTIHDTRYTAVSVGWTWSYALTHCHSNVISRNHIHTIGQGCLSDMGCIYLLGDQPGTLVSDNIIHGVKAFGYGGIGIYPDEGTTGVVIERNVVFDCGSDAFALHYGRDILVRRNFFAGEGKGLLYPGRPEPTQSAVFAENVFGCSGAFLGQNPVSSRFLGNHYLGCAPDQLAWGGLAWPDWQAQGHDLAGSVEPHLPDVRDAIAQDRFLSPWGDEWPTLGTVGHLASPSLAQKAHPFPLSLRLEFDHGGALLERSKDRPSLEPIYDSRQPIPISVHLTNRSRDTQPVALSAWVADPLDRPCGDVEWQVPPPDSLAPGESLVLDGWARVVESEQKCIVRATTPLALPIGSGLIVTQRPTTTISLLPPVTEAQAIKDHLAGVPTWGDPDRFSLRLALSETHLMVWARVNDARQKRGGMPWDGSAVEIYTALPGGNGRGHNAQLFLLLETDEAPPAAVFYSPDLRATDSVALHQVTHAGWYELSALVPLAEAKLLPLGEEILVEALVKSFLPGDQDFVRQTVFGGAIGHDNAGWAVAQVVRGD